MAVNNNIVSKPISLREVAKLIGYGGNDLGTLCTHDRVNMWARFKPVRDNRLFIDTDINHPISSGLSLSELWHNDVIYAATTSNQVNYERPNSVYRLGDFNLYKNTAIRPYGIKKVEKVEVPNRFVATVGLSINSVDSYNIQLSDVIPLSGDGWRLCALLTDEDFSTVYWWWASEYSWSSGNDEKQNVNINTSSITGVTLSDGGTYGIALVFVNLGAAFNQQNTGYAPRLLPSGTKVAFVPSLTAGENRFNITVSANQIFNDVDVYEFTFTADGESQRNPQGVNYKYNKYVINQVVVDVKIPSKYQSYITNNVLKCRCVLFVDGAYDASTYEESESSVISKGLGYKAFDITDYMRINSAIYNQATGIYTFSFNSIRLPYLYTDYESTGTHKWMISCRLTIDENDRIDYHPSEKIIWNSDDFDVKLNGSEDVSFNFVR